MIVVKKTKKKINIINKFINELLNVVKQIFDNLFNMRPKELMKFLIKTFIIIIFIYILKIPFDFIKKLGNGAFDFLFTPIDKFIIIIWTIIIEINYYIFSTVIFIYLFNKTYGKEKDTEVTKRDYEEAFTDLYRGFIVIISLPLVLTLVVLITLLLLCLYLLFQGILYFSFIIIIFALICLDLIAIYYVYQHLNKKKNKNPGIKKLLVVFTLILSLGLTLLFLETNDTKFYNDLIPNIDYGVKNQSLETNIDETIKVTCHNCHENYDIIYDNSLNDKIIIEVVYYDEFVQTLFNTSNKEIIISGKKLNLFNKEIQTTVINDLKKKEVHDFTLLYKQKLTIWVSERNEDNIKVVIN